MIIHQLGTVVRVCRTRPVVRPVLLLAHFPLPTRVESLRCLFNKVLSDSFPHCAYPPARSACIDIIAYALSGLAVLPVRRERGREVGCEPGWQGGLAKRRRGEGRHRLHQLVYRGGGGDEAVAGIDPGEPVVGR